jgi:hypothetical protein
MIGATREKHGETVDIDKGRALEAWNSHDPVRRAPEDGLINETFLVGDPPWGVLQWVNPIFAREIHLDIDAVTRRLEVFGLITPRLLPTASGDLWHEGEDGIWRMLSYVHGRTVHRMGGVESARSAGQMVGEFHRALADFSYRFRARKRVVSHDTPGIMNKLQQTLASCQNHALRDDASRLGEAILRAWGSWVGPLDLPSRICHGDLKISNILFETEADDAICLVDLDTLGPMPLPLEMGDAWRSWCNPAVEDDADGAVFDLDLFAASATSWLSAAPPLSAEEKQGMVPSIERICLELAARFCTDAVANCYFREDRRRFPAVGSHNLIRAQGQFRLAVSARSQRSACESLVSRELA